MGLTLAVDLVLENVKCRELWVELCGPLVLYGCFAGFLGSLVSFGLRLEFPALIRPLQLDSLMGATLQRTRYSLSSKLVLQDDSKVPTGSDVKVISGMDILTNNQVSIRRRRWPASKSLILTCLEGQSYLVCDNGGGYWLCRIFVVALP
jgi:hypothetical protein